MDFSMVTTAGNIVGIVSIFVSFLAIKYGH